MKECKEVAFCKKVFSIIGRYNGENLLNQSNLTDRERLIISNRILKGISLKECAEILVIEEDSVNKAQKKACVKLYNWLNTQSCLMQSIYA